MGSIAKTDLIEDEWYEFKYLNKIHSGWWDGENHFIDNSGQRYQFSKCSEIRYC